MSKFDNDGFQIVSSKRTSKNKPAIKIPDINLILQQQDPIEDTDKVVRQIRSAEEELKHSDYFNGFIKSVSTFIQSNKVSEIVCFGLGHIGEWQTSRYQLAVLLGLKDHYNVKKVLSHDPLFYKSECSILNTLDIEVITENKEGHYIISDENITILYLPHCSKQLTHNILWSNWGVNLKNCILICNSFTSLINNQPSRIISETVPLIQKIHPHTTEIPVDNNFKYTDIFNDTSIHTFPEENLAKLDKEFWEKGVTMALITSKPPLATLRLLLSELRKQSSSKKLAQNQAARYILDQYRKYQVTDQQLCKTIDEMHFRAKTYANYLHYSRKYKEINQEFKGKGERTAEETARMVGFKMPYDPKPTRH